MSREEAIEIFKRLKENAPNEMHIETVGTAQELFDMAIQALEQNESAEEWYKLFVKKLDEQEPCDDAISREMALKECHDIVVDGERYRVIQEETLLGLPPVTPSCDKCAMNGSGSKYCDNCGQMSGKCELKALIDKHRMYRLAYDELSEFERDVLELAESEDKE